jgi:hypothetical protein
MADSRLVVFVQEALRAGRSRQDVEHALLEAGWSAEQVRSALAAWSEVDFPVPVPQPRSQVSARDAALYLVMFGMLYVSAWHFGNLLIQFINLALPDPLLAGTERLIGGNIRLSTAALIVAYPVFLFLAFRSERSLRDDPGQRSSGVRRWLTYLTLAVAACVIVGDLVALLYSLLSGELTLRFVLKSLVVGGIAGFAMAYYLWSLKVDDEALSR